MDVRPSTTSSAEASAVRRKRVIFVIQEVAHFHELLKLAKALLRTGRYEGHFAAYTTYDGIRQDEAVCRQLGMQMYHGFYLKTVSQGIYDRYQAALSRVKSWVAYPLRRFRKPSNSVPTITTPFWTRVRNNVVNLACGLGRLIAKIAQPIGNAVYLAIRKCYIAVRWHPVVNRAILIVGAPFYWGARILGFFCWTAFQLLPEETQNRLIAIRNGLQRGWHAVTHLRQALRTFGRAVGRGWDATKSAIKGVLKHLPQPIRHAARLMQVWLRSPRVYLRLALMSVLRRVPRPIRHACRVVQYKVFGYRFSFSNMFELMGKRIMRVYRYFRYLVVHAFGYSRIFFVRHVAPHFGQPNLPGVMYFYSRRLRHFRRIAKNTGADLIVLAEDNVGHATGVFTRVARERGIPVFTLPYSIANAKEFAESYFNEPEHQMTRWPNRLVRRCFSRWTYKHRGKVLTRLPPWYCIGQELLRIAPPNPWAFNSGYSDTIIVESPRTVDYYRRAGVTNQAIEPIGAMFDDELAECLVGATSRREALYRRLDLPAGRPMLLTALPPNQLLNRKNCCFTEFNELIRAWLVPLVEQSHFNVVVRLHPRTNRASMQWIEDDLGLKICEDNTASMVPLCDLYLACVSATIRWAVVCGKPVINYDVYDYQYDDYDDAPGVLTTNDYQTYVDLVRRTATDRPWFEELRRRQEADCQRWGTLDGNSAARIVAFFEQKMGHGGLESHEDRNHRHGTHGQAAFAGGLREAA